MEVHNGPAPSEPTTQPITTSYPPSIAPGLERQELRQKMIEILASTANGCLEELGYYPGIHDKVQQLEQRASSWQVENVKLFDDNRRLCGVISQQKQVIDRLQAEDQRKATAIQQLQVGNGALTKTVEDLEATLLKKDPTGSAEFFNRKFNSLLKEYQALAGEHTQTLRHLQQLSRISSNAAQNSQQVLPIGQNIQQTHQIQSNQQQQQPQQQHQRQQHPHPSVPSQLIPPNTSAFTSLTSQPVNQQPQRQNVVYQQPIQASGASSDRRPSASMQGSIQQMPVHQYHNMQQPQQLGPAQAPQSHPLPVPTNQPPNLYPNGSAQPPQRANTHPIVQGQTAQHPQPHAPQSQMVSAWTSWLQSKQPMGNQSQPPQGLRINTLNAPAQNAASPRPTSSPKTLAPTPNSAPFPSVSPHNSQYGRLSATPNVPSRPSSLSQASSPMIASGSMPQSQQLNGHTPLHSPSLKRSSLSLSTTPSQSGDDFGHKRPRIDGPSMIPNDISGLPSPITPSVQHVHTMPGLTASIPSPHPSAHHPQFPPASSTTQQSPAPPVEVKPPVNPPVTPAQSQSPQPPKRVVEHSLKHESVSEAEAMAVDADQSANQESAEVSMQEDADQLVDEEEEDGETVEVGPDGLRLVSDCLNELFGKDRSGTFVCKFCAVRHKMNLMSEPPVTYESPSDELLAEHLQLDHKTVWDSARAVDD